MNIFPISILLSSVLIAKFSAQAQVTAGVGLGLHLGRDVATYETETTSGRQRQLLSELDETTTCTEEKAQGIQSTLMTDDYEGADSGVSCKCLTSPANNMVSCLVPRDDECEQYRCKDGWECTNTSDSKVTVCTTVTEEQLWEITPTSGFSRKKVIDSRYFYKGVSNLQSRSVETDRTTEPASCSGYYVDGEACASCERCHSQLVFMVVANCTNVIEGAVATCQEEEGNMLKKLLVLDSNATAPTPSPTSSPASPPTSSPTVSSMEIPASQSSSYGRPMLEIGMVASVLLWQWVF